MNLRPVATASLGSGIVAPYLAASEPGTTFAGAELSSERTFR